MFYGGWAIAVASSLIFNQMRKEEEERDKKYYKQLEKERLDRWARDDADREAKKIEKENNIKKCISIKETRLIESPEKTTEDQLYWCNHYGKDDENPFIYDKYCTCKFCDSYNSFLFKVNKEETLGFKRHDHDLTNKNSEYHEDSVPINTVSVSTEDTQTQISGFCKVCGATIYSNQLHIKEKQNEQN